MTTIMYLWLFAKGKIMEYLKLFLLISVLPCLQAAHSGESLIGQNAGAGIIGNPLTDPAAPTSAATARGVTTTSVSPTFPVQMEDGRQVLVTNTETEVNLGGVSFGGGVRGQTSPFATNGSNVKLNFTDFPQTPNSTTNEAELSFQSMPEEVRLGGEADQTIGADATNSKLSLSKGYGEVPDLEFEAFEADNDVEAADQSIHVIRVLYGEDVPVDNMARYMKIIADGGAACAQLIYAYMLFKGNGAPVNNAEGERYLKMVMASGNLRAQYEFAKMLLKKDGVPMDQAEGRRYLKMAADAGHPRAQYELAKILLNGKGVPIDKAEGRRYLKMAADAGYPRAQEKYQRLFKRRGLRRFLPF
ncbi:MAG: sel1 repeat family protein [Holosporales bacterium]|jgi:hypothetical protein|nr:sel1 repeat family protein [Holosporales bacterium]